MSAIRHVCGGHEYRYDTLTGVVTNNYGTRVATLGFCKFTGIGLLYQWPGEGKPTTPDHLIASRRDLIEQGDAECAKFAIGHVACSAVAEERS